MRQVNDLLLYDLQNPLEVVGTRLTEKLKEHALCGGNHRAGLPHAMESHLTIEWPTAGDRIGADPDVRLIAKQVQDCLLHANVGFGAGDDQLVAASRGNRIAHALHAAAEQEFFNGSLGTE